MGYRGYRGWASWQQPSKFTLLTQLFGDGVIEIKNAFLNLDEDAREKLLLHYGKIHGDSAESYARKKIFSWKSGATKLSGKTMEKLVELVPPYLPTEIRLKILKSVLIKNKQSGVFSTVNINVKEPTEGFSQLDKEILKMNVTDQLAYLPKKVMQAAEWLYSNEVTMARAMLAEAAKIENDLIKKNALKEIELLKRTIASGQVRSAHYTVVMPAGSLSVNATSPSLLSTIFSIFK